LRRASNAVWRPANFFLARRTGRRSSWVCSLVGILQGYQIGDKGAGKDLVLAIVMSQAKRNHPVWLSSGVPSPFVGQHGSIFYRCSPRHTNYLASRRCAKSVKNVGQRKPSLPCLTESLKNHFKSVRVSNPEQRRLPHKLPVVGRRLAAKLNLAGSYVPVKSFDEIVGPGLAFGISPRIRAPHRFRPPRAFPVVTVRSPYRSASTTFIG